MVTALSTKGHRGGLQYSTTAPTSTAQQVQRSYSGTIYVYRVGMISQGRWEIMKTNWKSLGDLTHRGTSYRGKSCLLIIKHLPACNCTGSPSLEAQLSTFDPSWHSSQPLTSHDMHIYRGNFFFHMSPHTRTPKMLLKGHTLGVFAEKCR